MAATRSELVEEWRSFYREHRRDAIAALASSSPEERSLYVDVVDLHRYDPSLAEALLDDPDAVLTAAEAALCGLEDAFDRVAVRVENVPGMLEPGTIRSRHVGELVAVQGVVSDLDPVRARLEAGVYGCRVCGDVVRRERDGIGVDAPARCAECGTPDAHALDGERSAFVDVRRFALADVDDRRDDGAATTVDVRLDDDLVDAVDPGEQLLVTGIVRVHRRGGGRFDFRVEGLAVNGERPGGTEEPGPREALRDVISSRWRRVADGR